jgi:hypothetical protein
LAAIGSCIRFLGERHDIRTHNHARRPGAGGIRIVTAGSRRQQQEQFELFEFEFFKFQLQLQFLIRAGTPCPGACGPRTGTGSPSTCRPLRAEAGARCSCRAEAGARGAHPLRGDGGKTCNNGTFKTCRDGCRHQTGLNGRDQACRDNDHKTRNDNGKHQARHDDDHQACDDRGNEACNDDRGDAIACRRGAGQGRRSHCRRTRQADRD